MLGEVGYAFTITPNPEYGRVGKYRRTGKTAGKEHWT